MTDIEEALVYYDGDNSKPCCDTVHRALKKQQPMKLKRGKVFPDVDTLICPVCGYDAVEVDHNYCPKCGQAVIQPAVEEDKHNG